MALTWADDATAAEYVRCLLERTSTPFLVNFALAAGIVAVTAKISLRMMMASILFGYIVRLGLIFLAVYLVKDAGWISLPALGATIIFTHLGLLVWELKYVAMSLAYPGLKPKPSSSHTVSKPAAQ